MAQRKWPTPRGWLLSVSRGLGSIPSPTFVIVYVSITILFAFVYHHYSQEFFHSTVRYEVHVQNDADKLMARLRDSFLKQYQARHGTRVKPLGGKKPVLELKLDTVRFVKPRIQGSDLMFVVEVAGKHAADPHPSLYDSDVRANVTCDHFGSQHASPAIDPQLPADQVHLTIKDQDVSPSLAAGEPRMGFYVPQPARAEWITQRQEQMADDDETFAPIPVRRETSLLAALIFEPDPCGQPSIVISRSLSDELKAFADAVNGFPSKVDGSFWRMFYFSTTTITTLGFGDIVPLTTRTRILVAIESFSGVLLVGLFLNSLAQEAQAGRPRAPDVPPGRG